MKWFSLNGILKEIKMTRWPKTKDLVKDSLICIVFVAVLAVFFFLCQVVASWFMTTIGM